MGFVAAKPIEVASVELAYPEPVAYRASLVKTAAFSEPYIYDAEYDAYIYPYSYSHAHAHPVAYTVL